ncbi:MAG: coenzyme F420 hydrogenase [Actinomyces sp.]|nr:MAG: coenzyme F420 hydrogenase [Actinomyces sp.]
MRSIADVVERQLCTGCGMCAVVQPDDLRMVDDYHLGRRPVPRAGREGADTTSALAVCPGVSLEWPVPDPEASTALWNDWGPVLEVWEGHAVDPTIRRRGSSGGVGTALASFAVAGGGQEAVVHIRARDDIPYLNEATVSEDPEAVAAAAGSRYSPASACEGLSAARGRRVAFVGKPCEVAAVARARTAAPPTVEGVEVTIAIFCAGTPSVRGTVEMMNRLGFADPAGVDLVRYRGEGWPGRAVVEGRGADGERRQASLSYQESWGEVLQAHRQWRCHLCVDHTGEFADLAVGDPWYREVRDGEPGRSLVVVRTPRGREFVRRAREAGVVELVRVDDSVFPRSQPNLLDTRGSVWGRMATLRALGLPAPRYRGPDLFSTWRRLGTRSKISSVLGTVRRIGRRRLLRRARVVPFEPRPPVRYPPGRRERVAEVGSS